MTNIKTEWTREEKDAVSEMLRQWGQIMSKRAPKTDTDHLDIKALHKMHETKTLIKALQNIGIQSNTQLMDMGFLAAGMVLRFKAK